MLVTCQSSLEKKAWWQLLVKLEFTQSFTAMAAFGLAQSSDKISLWSFGEKCKPYNLLLLFRKLAEENCFEIIVWWRIITVSMKNNFWKREHDCIAQIQSYEIKSPPWTIWWFRILGIFSVENIDRLGDFMFQTSDNSQLCIDSQYSSQQLIFVWSLKHQISQPIYIFNRVRVLHLDRLKEGTWLALTLTY